MLDPTIRNYLIKLYRDGYKEHINEARNCHIWALGSNTNEESTQYELQCSKHRAFAKMCKEMAEKFEAEVEFPEEFDFISHINPAEAVYHAKAKGNTYMVTCEGSYKGWTFFKKEVHESIFNGDYEIIRKETTK